MGYFFTHLMHVLPSQNCRGRGLPEEIFRLRVNEKGVTFCGKCKYFDTNRPPLSLWQMKDGVLCRILKTMFAEGKVLPPSQRSPGEIISPKPTPSIRPLWYPCGELFVVRVAQSPMIATSMSLYFPMLLSFHTKIHTWSIQRGTNCLILAQIS